MDPAVETALARHGEAVATARELARRTGALRVVLLVDRGEEPPLMVDCDQVGVVELTDGDALATIPAQAPVAQAPRALADVRAIPATAISVDLADGELAAPLGAIEHVADALKQLAGALGRRSVATAELATSDPETPITLAAREGEPVVVAAGEHEYTLPR